MQITNEQWALYEERYGKLMHTISMKISGDLALASHEDNYSDLTIAALESIDGFKKKTGQTFEEAMENKLFDQYTKTVLWNRKAKKGIPLSKKIPFRNKQVSLDVDAGDDSRGYHSLIPDTRAQYDASAVDLDDFTKAQSENVQKVMNAILGDPNILSKDGTINHSAVRETTGLSVHFAKRAVENLTRSLRRDYEV